MRGCVSRSYCRRMFGGNRGKKPALAAGRVLLLLRSPVVAGRENEINLDSINSARYNRNAESTHDTYTKPRGYYASSLTSVFGDAFRPRFVAFTTFSPPASS